MGNTEEIMSGNDENDQNSWLPLVAENYGITIKGEPILLNQRDEQRVYRIDTSEGTALTLRLCPPARSYERIVADTQALLYLKRHDFPAPALILTKSGAAAFAWKPGSWAYVQEFIEGKTHELDLKTLQELAALLGRLHIMVTEADPYPAQVNWLDELDKAIGWAESSVDNLQWGKQATEMAASLKNLPDLRSLPTGLIHSDAHEGNLLRTPDGKLYLIDWEDAGIGQMILDVALVLGWLCTTPASKDLNGQIIRYDFDAQWCKGFLKAYQQVRPFTSVEAHRLGAAIRFVVGWFAARDIPREIKEPGVSEGLALTHWAIVRSITPTWEKVLAQWVSETAPQATK